MCPEHRRRNATDHPLPDREPLQSPILRPFEREIRDIEEGTIEKAVSKLHVLP